MFKFGSSALVVDLFTSNSSAFEWAKPALAEEFYPSWWKQLPRHREMRPDDGPARPMPNMRGCAGFIDLYQHGFIVPMWSDLAVVIEPKQYKWQFADEVSNAVVHAADQAGSFLESQDMRSLKLITPWVAATKESVYWQIVQPLWSQGFQTDWVVPPAAVNFKNIGNMNVNMLVRGAGSPKDFTIPFTTPMVHYVPMSEKPVKLKYHLVTEEEFKLIHEKDRPLAFEYSYFKKLKAKKIGRAHV